MPTRDYVDLRSRGRATSCDHAPDEIVDSSSPDPGQASEPRSALCTCEVGGAGGQGDETTRGGSSLPSIIGSAFLSACVCHTTTPRTQRSAETLSRTRHSRPAAEGAAEVHLEPPGQGHHVCTDIHHPSNWTTSGSQACVIWLPDREPAGVWGWLQNPTSTPHHGFRASRFFRRALGCHTWLETSRRAAFHRSGA